MLPGLTLSFRTTPFGTSHSTVIPVLQLLYVTSAEHKKPLVPGEPAQLRFNLMPASFEVREGAASSCVCGLMVPAGDTLGLVISTSDPKHFDAKQCANFKVVLAQSRWAETVCPGLCWRRCSRFFNDPAYAWR